MIARWILYSILASFDSRLNYPFFLVYYRTHGLVDFLSYGLVAESFLAWTCPGLVELFAANPTCIIETSILPTASSV